MHHLQVGSVLNTTSFIISMLDWHLKRFIFWLFNFKCKTKWFWKLTSYKKTYENMILIHNRNAPKYCYRLQSEIINCVENNQERWSYLDILCTWPHTPSETGFYKSALKHLGRMQAGDKLAGEEFCRKGLGSLNRQQAQTEPVVCPGSKGGQQPPGPVDEGKWLTPLSTHCGIIAVGRELWRPSKPNPCPKQGDLKQAAQGDVQSGFELQRWRLYNLSDQTVSEFDHPYNEEFFPNV